MSALTGILVLLVLAVTKEEAHGTVVLSPHVTIPQGVMVGETGLSRFEREFHKFWCIPYAKVNARFERAVPPDPWKGTFDARDCGARCPNFLGGDMAQMMPMSLEEDEECLILNVFTPAKASRPLPVMVFIHGGYFQLGSSLEYSGEILMDEDVILVTINYRLGALGFLDSGDGEMEANNGLKDCVMALKWIQKNIVHFSGDPTKVTIFGESAGAGAVSFLVMSPMAKGLFHHAISQSGSSTAPWSYQSRPVENFQGYTESVGCKRDSTAKALDCLRTKTIEELTATQKTKWFMELNYTFYPSIELTSGKDEGSIFLPDHPRRMLKEGRFNRVPYIIGVVEDEGAYQSGLSYVDSGFRQDLNQRWTATAPIAFGMDHRNVSIANLNKGFRQMRQFYFGDDDLDKRHLHNLTDLYSDAWFIASMDTTIRYYSRHAPIYPYVFTKKGALRLANSLGIFERDVASHGDDLFYLFWKGTASSEADDIFSQNFVRLWVSFAYTGKPKYTWGLVKQWPYVEPGSVAWQYLQMDDIAKIIDDPYVERMKLWQGLLENEWSEI